MKLPIALTLSTVVALIATGCMRVKPDGSEAPSPVADSPAAEVSDDVPVEDPYQVKFETSKGDVLVQVHPEWAPRGAARFKNLVESGFYDETRFFRVVPGFMVQWGINGDPAVQANWRDNTIPDDPVRQSNTKGKITFATSGPNSRTAQVFINYGDNSFLDGQGFSPFGEVISGMDVVESINAEHGENPSQGAIQSRGNEYLNSEFPSLDYIKKATVIESPAKEESAAAESTPEKSETEQPEATKPETEKPDNEKPAAEKPADEKSEAAADKPAETIEEIK